MVRLSQSHTKNLQQTWEQNYSLAGEDLLLSDDKVHLLKPDPLHSVFSQ